jgi:hypothetical protein
LRAIGLFDGNDGYVFAQHCERNFLDKQANRLRAGAEHFLRKQDAEKSQSSGKASIHFATLGNIRQTSQTNQMEEGATASTAGKGRAARPLSGGFRD